MLINTTLSHPEYVRMYVSVFMVNERAVIARYASFIISQAFQTITCC